MSDDAASEKRPKAAVPEIRVLTQQQSEVSAVVCIVPTIPDPTDPNTVITAPEFDPVLKAIRSACKALHLSLQQITYEDLMAPSGCEGFAVAELVIVDVTHADSKAELFYQLGVRESLGLVKNIVLHAVRSCSESADIDNVYELVEEVHRSTNSQESSHVVVPYTSSSSESVMALPESVPLYDHLKKLLSTLSSSEALDSQRALFFHQWLVDASSSEQLNAIRDRLLDAESPIRLSSSAVIALLLRFRDLRDHSGMIDLVDASLAVNAKLLTVGVAELFVFALNRRNVGSDRERALKVIEEQTSANAYVDTSGLLCARGRIRKDEFVASGMTNESVLCAAADDYFNAFAQSPTTYAAINAATCLVVSGQTSFEAPDARLAALLPTLWGAVGRAQPFLKDVLNLGSESRPAFVQAQAAQEICAQFWTIATALEVYVLASRWQHATDIAEAMLSHRMPELWMLQTTAANLRLILHRTRNPPTSLFRFWMEFLEAAIVSSAELEHTGTDKRSFPLLEVFHEQYLPSRLVVDRTSIACYDHTGETVMWICKGSSLLRTCSNGDGGRSLYLFVRNVADLFHIVCATTADRDWLSNRAEQLRLSAAQQAHPPMRDIDRADSTTDPSLSATPSAPSLDTHSQSSSSSRNRRQSFAAQSSAQKTTLREVPPNESPFRYSFEVDASRGDGSRELLGSGSCAHVFGAFNKDTGHYMAVKVVPMARNRTEQSLPLIEEIHLLKKLRHPNIVDYYGSQTEGNTFLVFMEWVSGGSLKLLLRKWNQLSTSVVRSYTAQALLGVEYLHKCGIVHRDIKCANILVSHAGLIKISDFGCSKRLKSISMRAHSVCGTAQFMAPEVINNQGRGYGREADIWSMGCTIIEMCSGKTPWSEIKEDIAVMFRVGSVGEHPPFPDVCAAEDDMEDFLKHCFVRDPVHRATARLLLQHPFISHVEIPRALQSIDTRLKEDHDVISMFNGTANMTDSHAKGSSAADDDDTDIDSNIEFDVSNPQGRIPARRVSRQMGIIGSTTPTTEHAPSLPAISASPPATPTTSANSPILSSSTASSPAVPATPSALPRRSSRPSLQTQASVGSSTHWGKLKRHVRGPAMRDVAGLVIERTRGWLVTLVCTQRSELERRWREAIQRETSLSSSSSSSTATSAATTATSPAPMPLPESIESHIAPLLSAFETLLEHRSTSAMNTANEQLAYEITAGRLSIALANRLIFLYRRVVMSLARNDSSVDPSWVFAIDGFISSSVSLAQNDLSQRVFNRKFSGRKLHRQSSIGSRMQHSLTGRPLSSNPEPPTTDIPPSATTATTHSVNTLSEKDKTARPVQADSIERVPVAPANTPNVSLLDQLQAELTQQRLINATLEQNLKKNQLTPPSRSYALPFSLISISLLFGIAIGRSLKL